MSILQHGVNIRNEFFKHYGQVINIHAAVEDMKETLFNNVQ